ncbi:MAG: 3-deoxy-D-manno-octulosonic acid transferase [Planctomycetes bacterium]|nr:3-deoxy-D-manno-octulosonic acid transferase [Planctomycetota bacterium]
MSGILLDIAYAVILAAASPMWLYRMIRHGRYRNDIAQRFGAAPRRKSSRPCVWIHGVSLGEVNAARTLVGELHDQLSDYEVVVSSSTETGMAAARRLFGASHMVFRWPIDFSWAVRSAIDRIRPDIVVLMEGEVWPNFTAACKRRGIPVVVVNARMSADKGYPGYRKLGPLAARLFNSVTAFGVQDDSYARLYMALGVDADKLHVTGMMKFDTAETGDALDAQEALGAALSVLPEQQLIVAGGTGPLEEQIVLDAFKRLRNGHPNARLAIVPRKPERFDEVADLIRRRGFDVVRRSQNPDGAGAEEPERAGETVILGDTMGELKKFYALATCVFVGRSLVPMGGSDMIESAALGKPTIFGPHTFNFPQAGALAEHGCVRVTDGQGLQTQLERWLDDPASAERAGKEAQDYVKSQQGATKRNVEMIRRILKPSENQGTGGSTD